MPMPALAALGHALPNLFTTNDRKTLLTSVPTDLSPNVIVPLHDLTEITRTSPCPMNLCVFFLV